MSDGFLDKAYGARDAASTRKLYDDWAASYEAEISKNRYATPGRCAAALRAHIKDPNSPILDFGCGTGLSGLAMALEGFTCIDGVDLSAEMLAKARSKGTYRTLSQIEAGAPLAHASGAYAAITAVGVIGAGAAPISVFDTVMEALETGGLFVFSFNDHALEDPANEGKLNAYLDRKDARLLFQEYGDHLPGINLNCNVYIIEKT